MFDQNNVNLSPDAIGTQPRSSTAIPIAPLPAKSLAATGDARAEITLRSIITSYLPRSGHWQPQPKQPSAPVICRFSIRVHTCKSVVQSLQPATRNIPA